MRLFYLLFAKKYVRILHGVGCQFAAKVVSFWCLIAVDFQEIVIYIDWQQRIDCALMVRPNEIKLTIKRKQVETQCFLRQHSSFTNNEERNVYEPINVLKTVEN